MKGIKDTGDPNQRQDVFDTLPDGMYAVSGIEKFITTDDKEKPCFVPQNGDLVVRFEFRPVTGEQGPAGSATVPEFWMLVAALGGDVSVANGRRTSGDALIRAQESVNSNNTYITVQSTNGWANGLRRQLYPPKGKYQVKFVKAHRPDFAENDLTFQNVKSKWGKDQEQLVFQFEIVGSVNGKSTLYDGYRMWQYMQNPFCKEYKDLEGKVHNAVEEGCPLWGHTDNGGILPAAGQWKIFTRYFAPNILEHEWQANEIDQPQIVIIQEALKAEEKVVVVWKERPKSKNGSMYFAWDDVALENELPEIQIEEENVQPTQLNDLISYIEQKWKDIKIFDQSTDEAVVFTEAGKAWATQYLGPAWVKAGMSLDERKALHFLNAEEIDHLLRAFKSIHGEINQTSGW